MARFKRSIVVKVTCASNHESAQTIRTKQIEELTRLKFKKGQHYILELDGFLLRAYANRKDTLYIPAEQLPGGFQLADIGDSVCRYLDGVYPAGPVEPTDGFKGEE
jgi:hypothetical protein